MKPPCDEGVIRSIPSHVPRKLQAEGWILTATILASSMAFIDSTVVNVALPSLQSSLRATVAGVQWVVESYGLILAALILAGGSLGDLLGRRLIFLVGVGIFAAASMACGLAANIQQLIVARSVQGVGAALLVPGSLSIIGAFFDEAGRGRAIGTWSAFTAITTAAGPVLGGWLIEHGSWRWAFFMNVPIALAVIGISLWRVPESRSQSGGRIDWAGTLLVTLGLGGVVFGFIESSDLGWKHPLVAGSLIAGVLCLVLFAFLEDRLASPMVSPSLFQSPAFSAANLLTLFLYAALGIFFFLFPLELIQVQGYSTTVTGAAGLPMILLIFLLSRWSGGLVTRYGPRIPLVAGPLIAAAGFALFALPGAGAGYWKAFFPAFVVVGLGMATSVAPLTTVVMDSVGQDHAGTASGINNAVSRVAGVLAIAILGAVMVKLFSANLNSGLALRHFPPGTLDYIQANENRLAGLELPARLNLDAEAAAMIHASITRAFVFGFRAVLFICTGLSLVSAGVAWKMIPPRAD